VGELDLFNLNILGDFVNLMIKNHFFVVNNHRNVTGFIVKVFIQLFLILLIFLISNIYP